MVNWQEAIILAVISNIAGQTVVSILSHFRHRRQDGKLDEQTVLLKEIRDIIASNQKG